MALNLGPVPDTLTVQYVVGDPWEAHLVLKESGTPTPWPAAPIIEFPDTDPALSWPATLDQLDTRANWVLTEAQVNALHEAHSGQAGRVRLSVDGVTWWKGFVIPNA